MSTGSRPTEITYKLRLHSTPRKKKRMKGFKSRSQSRNINRSRKWNRPARKDTISMRRFVGQMWVTSTTGPIALTRSPRHMCQPLSIHSVSGLTSSTTLSLESTGHTPLSQPSSTPHGVSLGSLCCRKVTTLHVVIERWFNYRRFRKKCQSARASPDEKVF